jgi:hypothetical protein
MNVRELLRYELWSKETSRRILASARKLLKRVAVVLGVLVVLAGVVFAIEFYWLTSDERGAGKTALVRIEGLEGLIDCNCDQYAAVGHEARTAVDVAMRRAWTLRDRSTASFLTYYLFEVERYHDDLQKVQAHWNLSTTHEQFERGDRARHLKEFSRLRSELHKQLD